MVYAKADFIHVLQTEGKLFLKCSYDLVLTALDDYGRKCCLNLVAFSPLHFFQGASCEDPLCLEKHEKEKK
jgi:hypothetical protein